MKFKIQDPFPRLQFRNGFTLRRETNAIALHHLHHPTADIHEVHRWHLNKGWSGIGYSFFIDKQGNIFNGRGMLAVGSHINPPPGTNSTTIGIAVQGAYDTVDREMPDAQFNALVWLIKEIRRKYGKIPIQGHRDFAATACPGRFFPMDEVRRLKYRKENKKMFKDIKGHWAEQTIKELLEMGIVNGDGNGKFRPNAKVTRAEMAQIARNIVRFITGK